MGETSDSARPRGRMWGIVAVMAVAASVVFVAPASATHDTGEPLPDGVEYIRTRADGTEIFQVPTLFFYDDLTGDQNEYLVIFGGDMLDVCRVRPGQEDAVAAPSKMLVKENRNGTYLVKSAPSGHDSYVSVYRPGMSLPDFFDSVCGGFFGAGAPIPPPFATGTATLHHKSWVAEPLEVMNDFTPQPRGRYRNGVEGVVVDVDGNLYDVETLGVFRVRDPQGPPDFNTMTATLTPQAG